MYDAIIVGAWCAGSSTAMLLARRGVHGRRERCDFLVTKDSRGVRHVPDP